MTDLNKNEIEDRIAETLEEVEMEGSEEKYPAEYKNPQEFRYFGEGMTKNIWGIVYYLGHCIIFGAL